MRFFKIFLAALLACVVASVVSIILWILVICGVIASSGVVDSTPMRSNSILLLDLKEPIVDSPSSSLVSSFDLSTYSIKSQFTLLDVIGLIESAAEDGNIEGMLISPSVYAQVSTANLEEIRSAVERFKLTGKFVVGYADCYTQSGYYLASVADELYLEPEGWVDWRGVASTPIFYKGLLDKLNITIEAIRPAESRYKSAVEPYTRRDMSPENRKQMQALVDSFWGSISSEVALSRGVSELEMRSLTNRLDGLFAQDALKSGLVDELIYRDELSSVYSRYGVELSQSGECSVVSLARYSQSRTKLPQTGRNAVGVIYAEGDIYQGRGSDGVYSESLISLIKEARSDNDIKSVVLRVNSPGGDALAADAIWREVELLRREKPVIVSMGAAAASGGYYIAAPADLILADRTTVTGSIGVFGLFPYLGGALESKLGVTSDVVKSNSMADFASPLKPLTWEQKRLLQRRVDKVYDKFTSLVASGRNLSLEEVKQIAQGKVWSGEQALEIGLIDAIGGINSAIIIAADKGGISSDFVIKEVVEEPQGLDALLMFAQMKISQYLGLDAKQSELKSLYDDYHQAQKALSPIITEHGLVMYSPYRVEL
ncbi:MAG: signal peptide peptidase SppA [Rikenellaceae bacterium]